MKRKQMLALIRSAERRDLEDLLITLLDYAGWSEDFDEQTALSYIQEFLERPEKGGETNESS